jgi:hypothetical protein
VVSVSSRADTGVAPVTGASETADGIGGTPAFVWGALLDDKMSSTVCFLGGAQRGRATRDLSVGPTERLFGPRPQRGPQSDWPWEKTG